MMRPLRRIAPVILLTLLTLCSACEKPRWDDPGYVNTKLQSEDRNERSLAMSNVSSLNDELRAKILPGLISVYKNDDVLKKDAMKHILQIASPEASEVYLSEVETNATDQAQAAAEIIGRLKIKEAADPLFALYEKTDRDDVKQSILKGITTIPTSKMVPGLVEVLKLDVDRRPIALLAYACEAIGNLALEDPNAITDETVKQVTLAMFYANRTNQTLDRDCGLAVQSFGTKAFGELIKIYKGERDDIKQLFLKYDTQDTPYPANLAKIVAVQRLTSLRAKEFAPLAIEDLNSEKTAPKQLLGMSAVNWRVKEGQLTSEELFSLGDLKAEDGRTLLEGVAKGEKVKKEWDEITDRLIELQLRQDASFGLVRLGNREALPALLEGAKNGVIIDMERSAEILAKRGQPLKDVERWQLNWMLAQSYANLALEANRADFQTLIDEKKAKSKELGEKLESMLVMFDVAKECDAKGDDKAKAECYGAKLKDENELVREKAAWELGRLSADAARPVLEQGLDSSFLDTREIIVNGLYTVGNKETAKVIDQRLEAEASKGATYALDHYRLNMLKRFLLTQK